MISVGILGDTILHKDLVIDSSIKNILNSTDFNIVNLEAPIVKKSIRNNWEKTGLFQKITDSKLLEQLNIKAVSLANNHILDFGVDGLYHTINTLNDYGIKYFGAGKTLNEALNPAIIEIENKKLALFGFMQRYYSARHFASKKKAGIPEFKKNLLFDTINNNDADFKIIFNHWNQEFEDYPEPVNKKIAEQLINNSDLIVGSHPHCLQGYNIKSNKYIFYSLGNFSMPNIKFHNGFLTKYPDKCYKSIFIIANIYENNSYDIQTIPFLLNDNATRILAPDIRQEEELCSFLNKISKPLELNNKQYKIFYKNNRSRKLRPIQRENSFLNWINMRIYYFVIKTISIVQRLIASFLDLLGIREKVRTKLSKYLNQLNTIK